MILGLVDVHFAGYVVLALVCSLGSTYSIAYTVLWLRRPDPFRHPVRVLWKLNVVMLLAFLGYEAVRLTYGFAPI